MASTKKTGNESVKDIDPGGTRPARGGGDKTVDHHVESGDRNKRPDPKTKPDE
jgi:hypothetical protein